MSLQGIGSTRSPPVSGLIAFQRNLHKSGADRTRPLALPVATDASRDSDDQWASAIAAALGQLGLTTTPAGSTAGAMTTNGSEGSLAAGGTSSAPRAQQQQVQQYRDVAATVSSLSQALNGGYGSASSMAASRGDLATVFQGVWSSLGESSGNGADADVGELPSLHAFVQTLAQQFGESGLRGLRGVFVDTLA